MAFKRFLKVTECLYKETEKQREGGAYLSACVMIGGSREIFTKIQRLPEESEKLKRTHNIKFKKSRPPEK